jgi:hypothetical protein
MERAQVSIFVIIGLVLIIFVGFILFNVSYLKELVGNSQRERMIGYDYNEGLVRNSVAGCIDRISLIALEQMGLYSGYLNATPMPEYDESGAVSMVAYGADFVPVLLDSSGIYNLTIDNISSRICNRLYVDLGQCIDVSFQDDPSLEISRPVFDGDFGKIPAYCRAVVKNESVFVKLDYPVMLSSGKFSINTTDFSNEENIALKKMYDASIAFAQKVMAGSVGGTFSLSGACPANFSLFIDNGNVFRLVDNASRKINQYTFRFAIIDYTFTDVC